MICLAFDFGTASWGCAVGDSMSMTTRSLCGITAVSGAPEWTVIDQLIKDWQPECIVIGYPVKASGERFKLTDKVDTAIEQLSKRYDCPIHRADERLTTVEARERLFFEKGIKGLAKGKVDAESARLILEGWFENGSF